jgi:hypothetical protein
MDIKNELQKFNLKEVYNHDDYLEYLNSKAVRSPRTGTILDFISKEQEIELRKQKNVDLKSFDPTPKYIRDHINFAFNVYYEICQKKQDDELLEFLKNSEAGKTALISTNWYEKYNYLYQSA